MKHIIVLFALLASCVYLRATDAVFESSDGLWTDSTVEAKGRDFRTVLWDFEAYKLKQKDPFLLLVRVTEKPAADVKKDDIKWKVPSGKSSGHALMSTRSLTEEEAKEVTRRADAAYERWKSL